MSNEIVRKARVHRIGTGHGSSALGIEVLLVYQDEISLPVEDGEEVEVIVRRLVRPPRPESSRPFTKG